jgi:tetratricopeptide (TPR) repeat protein
MRAWILCLIAGLVLSAGAQRWIDGYAKLPAADEDALYFQSGEMLKKASVGFDGLLADFYWIRAIRYFGQRFEAQRAVNASFEIKDAPQLERLLNITTELDPRYIAVYQFGAFFLEPARAIEYVQLGIRNNPEEWRLYADLGFLFWRTGRYREAADAYLRGGRIAGAPAWMEAMAATTLERGGEFETARELFRHLCEENQDPFIRGICEDQMRK